MYFITDIGLFFLACIITSISAYHFNIQLSTYGTCERIGYVKGTIDLNHRRYREHTDFHLKHFIILKDVFIRDLVALVFILVGLLGESKSIFTLGVVLVIYEAMLLMYGFRLRYVYQLKDKFNDVRYGFIDALRQYRFYELLYWLLIAIFLFGYGHGIPL